MEEFGVLMGDECDAWTWYVEDFYLLKTPDDPDWARPKYIIRNQEENRSQLTPHQEWAMIKGQIDASLGFDIDWSTSRCLFNYHPLDFDGDEFVEEPEKNLDLINMLCKKFLAHYNQENKTDYEFVKALYANFHGCIGIMFLITFQVKNPVDNLIEDFRARVHYSFSDKTQFVYCMPKSEQEGDSTDQDSLGVVVENDPKKPRLE